MFLELVELFGDVLEALYRSILSLPIESFDFVELFHEQGEKLAFGVVELWQELL